MKPTCSTARVSNPVSKAQSNHTNRGCITPSTLLVSKHLNNCFPQGLPQAGKARASPEVQSTELRLPFPRCPGPL